MTQLFWRLAVILAAFLPHLPASAFLVPSVPINRYFTFDSVVGTLQFPSPEAACTAIGSTWHFESNGVNESAAQFFNARAIQIGYCKNAPPSFGSISLMAILDCPSNAKKDGSGTCYVDEPCVVGRNCQEPPDSCGKTPNPISIGLGTKFLRETDIPPAASGLSLARSYRSDSVLTTYDWLLSNAAAPTPPNQPGVPRFGAGWRHQYQLGLTIGFGGANVAALRPDGTIVLFEKSGSAWIPTAGPSVDLRVLDITSTAGDRQGWRIVDPRSSTVESYSAYGRIQSVSTAYGQTTTYVHADGNGTGTNGGWLLNADGTPSSEPIPRDTLLRVQDHTGRAIHFQYDLAVRLVGAVDFAGQVTKYSYGASAPCSDLTCAALTAVTFPDMSSRMFLYNEPGLAPNGWLGRLVTGIVDERGLRLATYTYDAQGRAVSSQRGAGVQTYALSFLSPSSTQVTDPLGSVSTYSFATIPGSYPKVASRTQPAGSGCAASSQALSYDNNGNVASEDDFNGNRACTVSDQTRNLALVRVEGLTTSQSCSFVTPANSTLPAGSRKVSRQWHPDWRFETRRAEPGRITTFVYNGQPDPFSGNATASCAPAAATLPDGKPIAVLCKQVEQATTDVNGAAGFTAVLQSAVPARISSWTYNAAGQPLSNNGPRSDLADVTNYTYYADTAFAGVGSNSVGHTVGDLASSTNALGQATLFTKYNRAGQLLETSDPNGVITTYSYDLRQRMTSSSVGGQTTFYEYWANGLLKRATAPDGSFVSYEYDAAQRLSAVADNLGNRIEYTLDNAGNRTAENVKDPGGTLRRQVARSIDALGRVQRITGRE